MRQSSTAFLLVFMMCSLLTKESYSQEFFKSDYKLIINKIPFDLEYFARGNAHNVWPDQNKFRLLIGSCVNDSFCVIDSIAPNELANRLTSIIKVKSANLNLGVFKIVLQISEPVGREYSLVSNPGHIKRRSKIALNTLPSNSKVKLQSMSFKEGKKKRIIVSNAGWIIR